MRKTPYVLLISAILITTSCKKKVDVTDASNNNESSPTTQYKTVTEKALQGVVRTQFDSPHPTPAQLSRRDRNNTLIRGLGLPVLESLPVVEDDKIVKLRSPEETARRCLATTFCAVKGESLDQKLVDSLIQEYSATDYFSPAENKFISDQNPPKQQQIDFCWRYECVHVFVWALKKRENLAGPSEACPVSDDITIIKQVGPANFLSEAKLRSSAEILDMADLYYRLHWAAIDLRLKGLKSVKVNEEIVEERHRALNWLIRYMGQEWDDVTTDT